VERQNIHYSAKERPKNPREYDNNYWDEERKKHSTGTTVVK